MTPTPTIDVCIPWRDHGDTWRRYALDAVRTNIESYGTSRVILGDSDQSLPFNRSAARNNAAAEASGDVLVFMDADVIIDMDTVQDAVRMAGTAPGLVKPFNQAGFLTKRASIRYYATGSIDQDYMSGLVVGFIGLAWVIRRELFEVMNGFDPNFIGYGGEDNAFSSACDVLLGPTTLTTGTASALWHPSTRQTSEQNMSRLHDYWKIESWDDYRKIRNA